MTRLRLMKLMYIANREMFKKHGRPILIARASALQKGPVLSEVYDLVNGGRSDEAAWGRYVRNVGPREVQLIEDPSADSLSPAELEILNNVTDDFAQYDDWEIVELTHGFEEWRGNYPDPEANTSHPIETEDILQAVGMGEFAEKIVRDLQDEEDFERIFAS